MELFGDLWLLRPLWLLALPAVALAVLAAMRRQAGLGGWTRVIDPALLPVLTALGHVVHPVARSRPLVHGALLAAICLALSGPALRNADAPSFRNLQGMVLVMDLSPSVTRGGSLDDGQAAAARLLQVSAGRSAGLILFASEAYLAGAMTTDIALLESPIAVLDAETMPDTGSRPDRALAMAGGVLADAGIIGGDVVLLSDGGGVTPDTIAEAARIRQTGARVSAVFVEPAQTPDGMPAPDRGRLEELVDAGGGRLVTTDAVDRLASRMAAVQRGSLAKSDIAALVFTDLGRALLALALLPALWLFRRRL